MREGILREAVTAQDTGLESLLAGNVVDKRLCRA